MQRYADILYSAGLLPILSQIVLLWQRRIVGVEFDEQHSTAQHRKNPYTCMYMQRQGRYL